MGRLLQVSRGIVAGAGLVTCVLAMAGCATANGPPGAADSGSSSPDASSVADAGDGVPDADPDPDAAMEELPTACVEALALAAFDFEDGAAGWTHDVMPEVQGSTVNWRFDDWEVGTASKVGPAACHDGTGCWASRLDDNYISCQRAFLQSPAIDLSACAGESLSLTFYHWYDFWTGDWDGQTWFDGGIVEFGDAGSGWTSPAGIDYPGTIAINPDKGSSFKCIESDSFYVAGRPGYVGASAAWQRVEVPIPADLVASGFEVRFSYTSGVILESTSQDANDYANAGWYIDDLAVIAAEP